MEKLFKLVKELVVKRFHGTIEIRFRDGEITFCKKTEELKLT